MEKLINLQLLEKLYNKNCTSNKGFKYAYGTAGFRYNADVLNTVMFTTGILSVLRSIYLQNKTIGIMITASHNPPQDNGVKIVEPMGEMLDQSWESIATDLANSASNSYNDFITYLNHLIKDKGIDLIDTSNGIGSVIVGRDSRESGPRLLETVLDAVYCFQHDSTERVSKILDAGILTTPQLHYLVYKTNVAKTLEKNEIGIGCYFDDFTRAWLDLCELYGFSTEHLKFALTIDAANGVGGFQMEKMISLLFTLCKTTVDGGNSTNISIVNNDWQKPNLLNNKCGADYVKTNQCLPNGVVSNSKFSTGGENTQKLNCSFDGDADRVIFYYQDNENKSSFHLLDGDRISTLFAKFFQHLLKESGLLDASDNDIKVGVVQTAYANGNSTKYITEVLKMDVSCTPTGVKHLHHEAVEKYDIGIYFEANGHGTIVFSEKIKSLVNNSMSNGNKALKTIEIFTRLINRTVGDAISDMLGVLAVLCILNLTPQDWYNEYSDLPNKLIKVVVPDRTVFKTTNAERQLVSPAGLQGKIDELVSSYGADSRSFVRASGTEDAVRVYAESSTKEMAESLAEKVGQLVSNCCGE
ncbi:related to Phosphoacetylglucosamine mutase [Saccharomycodes ludwigii]|uniref:Phosphoacetylglucosamine mutase n=1 Tax=Saccharomycodes ludwigii TaxID=36035 RepID=A0A376B8T6_9ASCO|nr:related to Phosphoacetylglucosamine mutase [Saccharomycodes ludwigii]